MPPSSVMCWTLLLATNAPPFSLFGDVQLGRRGLFLFVMDGNTGWQPFSSLDKLSYCLLMAMVSDAIAAAALTEDGCVWQGAFVLLLSIFPV